MREIQIISVKENNTEKNNKKTHFHSISLSSAWPSVSGVASSPPPRLSISIRLPLSSSSARCLSDNDDRHTVTITCEWQMVNGKCQPRRLISLNTLYKITKGQTDDLLTEIETRLAELISKVNQGQDVKLEFNCTSGCLFMVLFILFLVYFEDVEQEYSQLGLRASKIKELIITANSVD